jgi:REP element-mobilizing transposase RayT
MSPPGTYFVTFSTWQRRRLFVVEPYARLFLKTIYGYRRQGKFQLHAFVVMPEHIHLLLTPGEDVTLERSVQLIKGATRTRSESNLVSTKKFGREASRITGFGNVKISKNIGNTFITIRWCAGWWTAPQNIVTARHTPDSS